MPEISPSRYMVTAETAHAEHWHRKGRTKACIMCGDEKPLSEFYAYGYTTGQGKRGTRYESRCKPCARTRRRQQTIDRPGLNGRQAKSWREANPDAVLQARRAYQASDHGKLMKAKHQRMRNARIRAGAPVPEQAEINEIYAEAMELEALFGVKFHVDHIVPLCGGGKHIIDNLQILTALDNMKKGARMPSLRHHGTSNA